MFTQKETTELLTWLFFTLSNFYGEHWQLSNSEAIALGEKVHDCLAAFPQTIAKKYSKQLEKWTPFVSLAIAGSMIIVPKVKQTISIEKEKKILNGNTNFRTVKAGAVTTGNSNSNVENVTDGAGLSGNAGNDGFDAIAALNSRAAGY